MAFNIMEMVTSQITPENLKAVAGMLGEDQGKVGSAISGAAPAILGGLVSSFARPEGRQAFERQLDHADASLPGNLASMLGGGNSNALISSGANMLGALLGKDAMGMLSSAIGSFSGLSQGSAKSLLGMAAPLLMGMLKGKGKSDGLGAGGLVELLLGQKDNIAKALPSQLGDALSGTGLLEGLSGKASGAASAVAGSTATAGRQVADKGRSWLGKLIPLIILALVAWAAYQFFLKPGDRPASSSVGAVSVAQLGDRLGYLMGEAGSVLKSINGVDDARAALTRLKAIDDGLEQLLDVATTLPSAEGHKLADNFAKLAPVLESAVGHAYDIPGVREVLAPAVDSILRKLKVVSQL